MLNWWWWGNQNYLLLGWWLMCLETQCTSASVRPTTKTSAQHRKFTPFWFCPLLALFHFWIQINILILITFICQVYNRVWDNVQDWMQGFYLKFWQVEMVIVRLSGKCMYKLFATFLTRFWSFSDQVWNSMWGYLQVSFLLFQTCLHLYS